MSGARARAALAAGLVLAGALATQESVDAAADAGAGPVAEDAVPEELRPWIPWVLAQDPAGRCPFLHGAAARRCAWPGVLAVDAGAEGARFRQRWDVFGAGAWVPLPGDAALWPEGVRADGGPLAVVPASGAGSGERPVDQPANVAAGRPVAWLAPGRHELEGRIAWRARPAVLPVPPETGLVALTLDAREVRAPERDAAGRLWLGERPREAAPEDRLVARVYRRVEDDVPLLLETRLALSVSGRAREVALGPVHPPGFVALALESPLPARLEADGRLRVQARAGEWTLVLRARHDGPAAELAPPGDALAPEEVWVFDARPALRVVSVEGAAPVDPSQTGLPAEWRHLPAYLLRPGEVLRLVERRRGDPDPANQLALARTLWLDFEGGGFTFHDEIRGRLRRGSRLDMAPPGTLGRAAVNGTDWFLTRVREGAPVGVEVPPGTVAVDADGRLERGAIPAVGWGVDFDSVRASLQLPPGWRLVHASGVDRAEPTWLGGWTLLDLFLVLVAASAAARLWGVGWGALALAALALTWTEPGAPRMAWLGVLAAEACVRVLRRSHRLGLVARGARLVAWAALALVAVPYLVGELQRGLHPSLVPPQQLAGRAATGRGGAVALDEMDVSQLRGLGYAAKAPAAPGAEARSEEMEVAVPPRAVAPAPAREPLPPPPDLRRLDPDARIPTGPGLPRWAWSRVELTWSGPVDAEQRLRLWLVSPAWSRALAFARLALVAALAYVLIARAGARGPHAAGGAATAAAAALLAAALGIAPASPARAEPPSTALLEELRARLLRPPACHPECASLPRLALELRDDTLRLRLEAHAAAATAIPVPGGARGWTPARAAVDAEPAPVLRPAGGDALWLLLAPGVHDVLLGGPIPPGADRVEIALPLRPRAITVDAPGWTAHGLDAEGVAAGTLELRRAAGPAAAAAPPLAPAPPPFFARVERAITLGVTWEVDTRVDRLSDAASGAVLEIPLLPGEAVATEGVAVEAGRARLPFAPGQRSASFRARLEPRAELRLEAPRDVAWVEAWRLAVQPLWHVETEGLAPVAVPDDAVSPPREWRPWPGESLAIRVTRPLGAGGGTLTIDRAALDVRPGERATDASLSLELRASQGGRHEIALPEGAELRVVRVDGTEQPIRADGRRVSLPLRPGTQQIDLDWRSAGGLTAWWRAPRAELGAPAVNLDVAVAVPLDRWVLWTSGPAMGPAVLFWSLLVVLAVVAAGLARVPGVPLRFPHWFLLGIGLTQVPIWTAAVVVAWLLALTWRRAHGRGLPPLAFDAAQLALALLTAAALVALFEAVRRGLLGAPEMQIAGHGSTAYALRWTQDRSDGATPLVGVLSAPILVYRLAMLAWALWLARALVGWLRWGFDAWVGGRHVAAAAGPASDGGGDVSPALRSSEEVRREEWEALKRQGMWRFLLVRGLPRGILMALLVMILIETLRAPGERTSWSDPALLGRFAVAAVLFSLGGMVSSWARWRALESRFERKP